MNNVSRDALSADTEMLLDRFNDDRLTVLIVDFNASPEEVRDWYFNSDPLEVVERQNIIESLALNGSDEGADERLFQEGQATEAAAITLLASISNSELFEGSAENWVDTFANARRANGSIDRTALLRHAVGDLANKTTPYTLSDIEKLQIAQDCLGFAGKSYLSLKDRIPAGPQHDQFRQLLDSQSTSALLTCVSLAHVTRDICTMPPEGCDKDEATSWLNAAINASLWVGFASLWMDRFVEDDQATRSAYLNTALLLRERFIDGIAAPERISGENKGFLHEALWLLDANFLLRQTPALAGTKILPASLKVDRPEIGRPQLKRSYDAKAILPEVPGQGTIRTVPVQLKSSKGKNHKGEYHPGVLLLEEENFMDIEIRRLSKKLDLYIQWAESGLDDSIAARIETMVLPTAHLFIEHAQKIMRMTNFEYILDRNPEIQLSRPERRRLQRALGKAASK